MRSPIMYDTGTPEGFIEAVEGALNKRQRIKVTYPDGWSESGYIGWSTGSQKAMLLAYNSRSMGGGSIRTDQVVKVETTRGKQVLWEKK